jgi:hypothetical protein
MEKSWGNPPIRLLNKSVIPTGAYPHFLLRRRRRAGCAAFRKESRMKRSNATKPDRKCGVA